MKLIVSLGITVSALAFVGFAAAHRFQLPGLILSGWCLVLSALTYVAYGRDKRAAQAGAWRVPESTLLGLCLFGGTPGGVIGAHVHRHKTSKLSYRAWFWCVVVAQVGLAFGILYLPDSFSVAAASSR